MKKHILLIIAMAFATFSIANAQNRQLRVWKGGSIVQSLSINDIDSLTIVSYSSNDDNDGEEPSAPNSEFIGTWSVLYAEGFGSNNVDDSFEYIQLKSDGTYIDVQYDEYEKKGYTIDYGKWNVANNQLVLYVESGILKGSTFLYYIVKKEKDKMTVTMWGLTAYLIRIDDRVIEKYLDS